MSRSCESKRLVDHPQRRNLKNLAQTLRLRAVQNYGDHGSPRHLAFLSLAPLAPVLLGASPPETAAIANRLIACAAQGLAPRDHMLRRVTRALTRSLAIDTAPCAALPRAPTFEPVSCFLIAEGARIVAEGTPAGGVASLVGITGGVISGLSKPSQNRWLAPPWRLRHDEG